MYHTRPPRVCWCGKVHRPLETLDLNTRNQAAHPPEPAAEKPPVNARAMRELRLNGWSTEGIARIYQVTPFAVDMLITGEERDSRVRAADIAAAGGAEMLTNEAVDRLIPAEDEEGP